MNSRILRCLPGEFVPSIGVDISSDLKYYMFLLVIQIKDLLIYFGEHEKKYREISR